MKKIPQIVVPIIDNGNAILNNLFELLINKKVIIFGVPGAFTPTCSEKHLPGFLKLSDKIKNKGIDDIFCLSVNDKFVMQSWLLSYSNGNNIKGIADGNAEISKALEVTSNKSANFMGLRCTRFAMIINDNNIMKTFIEEPGRLETSSAENVLKNI
jgi:peroxiredoxin